jgi:DHA2 family multidrug resistance protein
VWPFGGIGYNLMSVMNRGAITFLIVLANITEGLGRTIANVALPFLRGSLSASLDRISRVLPSYMAWRRRSRCVYRSAR